MWVLFCVVCPKSMPKIQFKVKHKRREKWNTVQAVCSSLHTLFMRRWHTQLCLGMRHAEAAVGGWLAALREPPSKFASLPKGPLLQRGFFHKRSPWRRPHFCWGGAAAALVGFAAWSDGGIGDERVSIFILTYQIRWPLPELGSLPGGYFPSGSFRSVSRLLPRKLTWDMLGKSPPLFRPSMRSWWRWSLVPWPSWISTGQPSALWNHIETN